MFREHHFAHDNAMLLSAALFIVLQIIFFNLDTIINFFKRNKNDK